MAAADSMFSDIVNLFKSWIPWRSEPANVSRDFWMPDESCRVCYECDVHFTLFNRRHHCRLCGRVFCGKCTSNRIPAQSCDSRMQREDWEKIRVCNYCFKQWQQGLTAAIENEVQVANLDLISTSPSATSFLSTKSSETYDSSSITLASMAQSAGLSTPRSTIIETPVARQSLGAGMGNDESSETGEMGNQYQSPDRFSFCTASEMGSQYQSPHQFSFCTTRSDEDDEELGVYHLDPKKRNFSEVNGFFSHVQFDMDNEYGSHKLHPEADAADSGSSVHNSFDSQASEEVEQIVKKEAVSGIVDECQAPTLYPVDVEAEPVDFENNGVLWLPPDPEDEDDAFLSDDEEKNGSGDLRSLHNASSFGSGEFRGRDKSNDEHKKVMKNVVDGHFRALVAQLLQVENLSVTDDEDKESWLEIITSLSWEAASLLKPDMSKGGQMDPGGYVKVKCIASGRHSESMVVRGIVCKKNVANRRMKSKMEKPRVLILGGALEYQRVLNHLSSFDTLLQQEMDHLKMAVAKIDAQNPDILLVEKSVSRYAQEYLLAKNISLVLNIKRPLLERIARCTDGQIVPSIDHLSSPKLGYCDLFRVERFLEEHGTAGQGGKKLVKTLMYFESCPKPLGCTILLRGAHGDELKKVKHVLQYGVFAAYHLAMETSFLADEGASLPELSFNSPIAVALPNKPSIGRSISTVPRYMVPPSENIPGLESGEGPLRSNSVSVSDILNMTNALIQNKEMPESTSPQTAASSQNIEPSIVSFGQIGQSSSFDESSPIHASEERLVSGCSGAQNFEMNNINDATGDYHFANAFGPKNVNELQNNCSDMDANQHSSNPSSLHLDGKHMPEEQGSQKEEFSPSASNHQSILVSLSSRCVWKGTVCERSHLFRIKYYGNFDKPLGRFLRDHLFDQSYRCSSCEMPSEAHVQCYTHRQGTLTISVKKLPEILLPGEREGKIWMWHRCLKCPRTNGFPPATRRVMMSDAAWGLSFGKFLELSFSNHAAASRVASCGHSLHRDCLRFYGFGKMVACFRYASIDVHSVYLPPPELDFDYENQEWLQNELNEVIHRAEILFSEVLNTLYLLVGKKSVKDTHNSGLSAPESRSQMADLEGMLQKEKAEFEETLQRIMNKEGKKGQPAVDILELNRLRRQLVFQSYMWDHRLIYAASLENMSQQDDKSFSYSEPIKKSLDVDEKLIAAGSEKTDKVLDGVCSGSVDVKSDLSHTNGASDKDNHYPEIVHRRTGIGSDCHPENGCLSTCPAVSKANDEADILDSSVARRAQSDGQFAIGASLSDTLDAAWTGENHPVTGVLNNNNSVFSESVDADSSIPVGLIEKLDAEDHNGEDFGGSKTFQSSSVFNSKGSENMEDTVSWLGMPFISFYRSLNKNFLGNTQKLDTLSEYHPVYISSFRESELQSGARLLLPVGVNDTVVPVYDDEPTSIISYALVSPDYLGQLSDEPDRAKELGDTIFTLQSFDSLNFQSFHSMDEMALESFRSLGSGDESILSLSASRSSLASDPLSYTKALHAKVSFVDDGPLGKVRYTVTCYYAKRFDALRKICCPSEMDYIRSLSRCKKWGAQGGKSNVFFAKTLDDRFIIKQVTKTELESFIKFAPGYFKYLSESIRSGSPTCLAKILGIYQVTSKHLKGGKESKMDVLVMENLLFRRNVTRLYDLKGSSRSRYNPDSSGTNKVLLDQNLIEAMPTSPIFVGNKAKRLLERAVWNDTAFLASIDVMDYSLLVGIDEEKHELVLGIIDFMRQYTWDKHLETWVKASGILGGPKNVSPTVISPKQYKKRFRKAMTTYFLMVPDQWSPPSIVPSMSQTDLSEENAQGGSSAE